MDEMSILLGGRMKRIEINKNAVSIVFIIGAVALAICGIGGWGWLIFGAIVIQ